MLTEPTVEWLTEYAQFSGKDQSTVVEEALLEVKERDNRNPVDVEVRRVEKRLDTVEKHLAGLQDDENPAMVRLHEISSGLKSVYQVARGDWAQIRYLALRDYRSDKPIMATIQDEQKRLSQVDLIKELNMRTEGDIRDAVRIAVDVERLSEEKKILRSRLDALYEKQSQPLAA